MNKKGKLVICITAISLIYTYNKLTLNKNISKNITNQTLQEIQEEIINETPKNIYVSLKKDENNDFKETGIVIQEYNSKIPKNTEQEIYYYIGSTNENNFFVWKKFNKNQNINEIKFKNYILTNTIPKDTENTKYELLYIGNNQQDQDSKKIKLKK